VTVDPPRLRDLGSDASDDLRALLRASDADGPSPSQLQRLAARLEPQLTTPATTTTVTVGKVIAIGVIVAVVAGVIGFVVGRGSTQAPSSPVAVVADAAIDAAIDATTDATTDTTTDAPLADAGTIVDASPVIDPPSTGKDRHRPTDARSQTPSSPPAPVEDEIAMLGRAQHALVVGDAAGALELAERHAKTFPSAMMIEEREAIAIEALTRLGRTGDAASRFARFQTAYPRSSYRQRLERLLAPN